MLNRCSLLILNTTLAPKNSHLAWKVLHNKDDIYERQGNLFDAIVNKRPTKLLE